jgi:hypothetical protein
MARKKKVERSNANRDWKVLHHRIYFTAKDETELVSWVRDREGKLLDLLNTALEEEWAIKVSPMDNGSMGYITVQSKAVDNEYGDHSFAVTWPLGISCYYVACFLCLEMGERGDLYRDVAMTQADLLDFLK